MKMTVSSCFSRWVTDKKVTSKDKAQAEGGNLQS